MPRKRPLSPLSGRSGGRLFLLLTYEKMSLPACRCLDAAIYQRLYDDLEGLLNCPDIGQGGRQRVERDLNRCRDVLTQLGMDTETLIV